MIDLVSHFVLSPAMVGKTPDGDSAARLVTVHEFGRADAPTVRVRTNAGHRVYPAA